MIGGSNSLWRRLLATLCGFTALAGVWLCVMEGALRHNGYEARALLDLALVAQSLLTLAFVFGLLRGAGRWIVTVGAVFAAYTGASAIVGNFQRTHFEGFVMVIGAALVLQSILTLTVTAAPLLRGRSA